MFLLKGKPLPVDTGFTVDDIQYPANWLRFSTPEERAGLGIEEVAEQARPDDRYFFVSDNGDGTFTAIPKDLQMLKEAAVVDMKARAASFLAPTDWKVVRDVEGGKPLDETLRAYRASVRAASDDNEAAINACTSVEQLMALPIPFPTNS